MRKKFKEPYKAGIPDKFTEWWNPTGTDEPSGASVGGHPDAARMWARKDPGKWVRLAKGISAKKAWLVGRYRGQYQAWIDAGRPQRDPFVSIVLPLADQKAAMDQLKATLRMVGRPMPTQDEPPTKQVTGKVIEDESGDPF